MLNISGIGGAPELPELRALEKRVRAAGTSPAGTDGVSISREAQRAAEAAGYLQQANVDPDLRGEAIERSRANLEQGAYRIQEAVLQVASRIEAVLA